MNPKEEKKWFVYLNDHHEGPLSVQDLLDRKKQNKLKPETYVWADGMGDWDSVSTFPELMKQLGFTDNNESAKSTPTADADEKIVSTAHPDPLPAPLNAPLPENEPMEVPEKKSGKLPKVLFALGASTFVIAVVIGTLIFFSHTLSEPQHATIRPLLQGIARNVPFLTNAIQLTPNLDDITPDDQAFLDSAVKTEAIDGPRVAIVLSRSDLIKPSFYVSTNLPNETKLKIKITGDGDTLLNELKFETETSITVSNGFTKTNAISGPGGSALPQGEYSVVVYEDSNQEQAIQLEINKYPSTKLLESAGIIPDQARFVFGKSFFLGGENDQNYQTRLRAFHEKIKDAAAKESAELAQFSSTLSSIFKELREKFKTYFNQKRPSPYSKSNWSKAYTSNVKILNHIQTTAQNWDTEQLKNEYFYGFGYEKTKVTLDSIVQYSEIANKYVVKPSDRDAFLIQIGESINAVEQNLDALRSTVDQIQNSPKSPAGLPIKEGAV